MVSLWKSNCLYFKSQDVCMDIKEDSSVLKFEIELKYHLVRELCDITNSFVFSEFMCKCNNKTLTFNEIKDNCVKNHPKLYDYYHSNMNSMYMSNLQDLKHPMLNLLEYQGFDKLDQFKILCLLYRPFLYPNLYTSHIVGLFGPSDNTIHPFETATWSTFSKIGQCYYIENSVENFEYEYLLKPNSMMTGKILIPKNPFKYLLISGKNNSAITESSITTIKLPSGHAMHCIVFAKTGTSYYDIYNTTSYSDLYRYILHGDKFL